MSSIEKGEAAKSVVQYSIFDNMKEVKKLTKDELIFEVEQWRRTWDYIPPELQGMLAQIGQEVIIFKRDGDSFQGFYKGFECKIDQHIFETTERIRSQVDKKFFIFRTTSKLPASNIVDFKFVKFTADDTPEPDYNAM